jgi:cell division transport system permease protein
MSNSSDGRPPAPPQRRAPEQWPADPNHAYSDRRHVADQRPGAGGNWAEPVDADWEPEPHSAYTQAPEDFDPRTGPATFEFQPSPLQPRQVPRVPIVQPYAQPAAQVQERLPHHPEDLRTGREGGQPALSHDGERRPDARTDGRQESRHELEATPTLSAPSRSRRPGKDPSNAAIVPAGSVTGRSLTLVIAIMCFLACLTAGAVYLMNQSANAWLRDIASEVTVQLEARDRTDIERELREVTAFLGKQPGIVGSKTLSLETSAGLLEPWLGQTEGLKNLPVPRLIAVEVDRENPPDFAVLRAALSKQFKGITLDDHRLWQKQIRTVTRSFALGGLAILMLVGAATTAVIVSATRSALAANREIVEVLHFVGATDRFIASQFQRHFLSLGIRAGVVGAVMAGLAFLGIPVAMELLGGGGSASVAEMQHLVGSGTLDLQGYGWLAIVVVVIAGLCMFTSRIGVYRILHQNQR